MYAEDNAEHDSAFKLPVSKPKVGRPEDFPKARQS